MHESPEVGHECVIQCITNDIHSWRLTHNFGELIWSSHSWYVCMRTGTVLYTTNNYTNFYFLQKEKKNRKTHRYDRIWKARIFLNGMYLEIISKIIVYILWIERFKMCGDKKSIALKIAHQNENEKKTLNLRQREDIFFSRLTS